MCRMSTKSTVDTSDRTDTAYKIAVGLQANPYVALELQYIDLGKTKYKGRDSFTSPTYSWTENEKIDFKTSGFGTNLIGTYPIEDFTLFGKVGYHYLKTKGSHRFHDTETGYNPYSVSGSKIVEMDPFIWCWSLLQHHARVCGSS